MALIETNIYQGIVPDSKTIIYTAVLNTVVRDMHVSNYSSTKTDISIWVDATGILSDDGKYMLPGLEIQGKDFVHWTGFKQIGVGGSITILSSNITSLSISIDGATL